MTRKLVLNVLPTLLQARLHSNPAYFNLASLVDMSMYLDTAYYGGKASVVHVPRRLRTCGVRALATRGHVGLPLTVVVVHQSRLSILSRLIEELQQQQIERYVLMATSEKLFAQLSEAYPFRVIPAFGQNRHQTEATVTIVDHSSSAIDKNMGFNKLFGSPDSPSPRTPHGKLSCESWIQQDTHTAGRIFTVAARLVRMGYAPFFIDQSAVVFKDYELALFQLPADGIYVTKEYIRWTPAEVANVSMPWPPIIFFPLSEAVESMAEMVATLADSGKQADIMQHVLFKTFALDEIATGGTFNDLSFPLTLHRARLVGLLDTKVADYEVLQARMKTAAPKTRCSNYSVALKRSLNVRSADIARHVQKIMAAIPAARAQSLTCIVLPSLVFEHRSAASIFKVIDSDTLTQLAGNVTLVPSIRNIDTDSAVYVDLGARHGRKQTHENLRRSERDKWLARELRQVVAAAKSLLGTDFVCARSVGIGLEDNAFVLRQQLDEFKRGVGLMLLQRSMTSSKVGEQQNLVSADSITATHTQLQSHARTYNSTPFLTQVFVRGMWRHLPERVWPIASSDRFSLTTLAHVRRALNGALSSFSAQPFGQGDSIAFDDAWADLVESAICMGGVSLDVRLKPAHYSSLDPAFLSGMPHANVENELAEFSAWLRRPDRTSLRGPFLVIPAPAHADRLSCEDWARAARLGMLLGYASDARHIVLPPTHNAWRAKVNMKLLHKSFTTVLPTAVARLLQPRLTFESLFNTTTSLKDDRAHQERVLTVKYASELKFVDRARQSMSQRSVMWTANASETLHNTMRLGLNLHDWIIVRDIAVDSAVTEHALRIAVAKRGDADDGLKYLRRVDDVFGSVCAATVS